MARTAVVSSNVKSLGYNPDTKQLEVEFLNGGLYRYHDVPPEVHQTLMAAPSIGKVMHAVATVGFRCERLDPHITSPAQG